MSDIDFQNGFIVGMATRGITRSGLMYEPIVWNDAEDYSGFYIDFKKPVEAFSTGMLTVSLVLHDSEQLPITGYKKISSSIFKVYCNIAGKVSGITVINKATSLLSFSTGEKVPPFSVHFYVSGVSSYIRFRYMYVVAKDVFTDVLGKIVDVGLNDIMYDMGDSIGIYDEVSLYYTLGAATESISIELI